MSEQKKLLACDGGGIRGIITLQFLRRIESILREQSGRKTLLLSEYFDYVAGTSTGAIIATCVSLGMSVDEIEKFYIESGPAMFSKASFVKRLKYKFVDQALARQLKDVIGATEKLGTKKLKTFLMIVMRNASTDSPWPLSNNPDAKYNERTRADCNLNIPLWQLVRASTAAPTYFPPEVVTVGEHKFIFQDGGVTMFNNPAYQLYTMATLPEYKLEWPTGEDQMLLVSVGTGAAANANADLKPGQMNLLYQAGTIPSALMYAAQVHQDLLCRIQGKCIAGDKIDNEIGDLVNPVASHLGRQFTYARYNVELDAKGLNALKITQKELKEIGVDSIEPEEVQQLDSVDHIAEMKLVGAKAAELKVKAEHFSGFPA